MSDEQRALFRDTQAMMSLLEGFGDHVMDSAGVASCPASRRSRPGSTPGGRRGRRWSGQIPRVTGLDLKMEQYARGERFVAGIERIGGQAALGRASGTARRRCPATTSWITPSAGPGASSGPVA